MTGEGRVQGPDMQTYTCPEPSVLLPGTELLISLMGIPASLPTTQQQEVESTLCMYKPV